MATKNNFSHGTNTELEGVETSSFTVDFVNTMASETSDLSAGSATAGLEAVRSVIGRYVNILSEGPLVDSGKQKNVHSKNRYVRYDNLCRYVTNGHQSIKRCR